jgi:hypothetical protein
MIDEAKALGVVVGVLKKALELAKKTDNLEVSRDSRCRSGKLRGSPRSIVNARAEIQQLKEALRIKDSLEFRDSVYWRTVEDDPSGKQEGLF